MERNLKLYFQLFWSFARIGTTSIGGGYVMLPVMQHELVGRRKWLHDNEILDFFAVGQSLPGLIAVNTAVGAGYRIGGFWGAVASVTGVTLPSLIIICIIAAFFTKYQENIYVHKAFKAVRAAVLALVVAAVFRLGKKALNDWFRVIIAVGGFILLAWFKVTPPLIILAGIVAGVVIYYSCKKGIKKPAEENK
ncbi:MAG: chromate transporter [Lentisphaerae bacterium]|nr:chromate transporter [Lentisphaerota bacterium]MCP4102662.1 chromate transporter [Lentisphaerota bacterium]